MKNPSERRPVIPPRWATLLLRVVLPEEDRGAAVDELGELYGIKHAHRGAAEAKRWYRAQVMGFTVRLLRSGRRRRVHATRASQDSDGGRSIKGGVDMTHLGSELKQSFRRLRRAPVFLVVSVLTLGIGIGAFTSVFGLAQAILLEDMPYESPDELAWVWRNYEWFNLPRGWLSGPDIAELRKATGVFEGVVGFRTGRPNLTGGQGVDPERIRVLFASHELFDLLGVQLVLGRGFLPGEDSPDAGQIVVLGHDFWTSRYGADRGMIGRTLFLDGTPSTVVGVAPENFRFVMHSSLGEPQPADLYANLRVELADQSPGAGSYAGLVRIRPGVGPDQLSATIDAAAELSKAFFDGRDLRLWSVGLKEDLTQKLRPVLVALVGSAAFLLLILAANLATLLLSRAAVRERELAVRSALGAGRGRIVTSVLTESAVIAVFGVGVGVLLTFVGTDVITSFAPDNLPRLGEVGVDGSILSVALLVTLIIVSITGAAPALQAVGSSTVVALKEGGARSGGSRRRAHTRSVLVTVQVALSLMLLVGSGLMGQAFARLLRQDPGFDPSAALTFRVPLAPTAGADVDAVEDFHRQLRQRLAALPGVISVGAANAVPLTQNTNQRGAAFPGAPGNTGDPIEDVPLVDWFRATDGYFGSAGIRILAGRPFDSSDGEGDSRVAIIDDVLADRFFADGSAVGGQIAIFADTATIVGVIDQPRFYNVYEDDRGQVYVPYALSPIRDMSYALKTELEPTSLIGAVRRELRALDPTVPLSEVRTLSSIVDASLGQQRLSLTLLGAFSLGSLLLCTLGLYGVVANGVERRTQEMGVRMALGADGGTVLRMILAQGLRLAAVGATIGLVGSIATARIFESTMVGMDTGSPLAYVGAGATLVAVAALAAYVPARRATQIDPVEALRPE